MLKKSDLVKQFELVVLQEIKDHNNSILASNLAITRFKEAIDSLDQKINELSEKTNSVNVNDNIVFKNTINNLYILIDKINNFVNEIQKSNQKQIDLIKDDLRKEIDKLSRKEEVTKIKESNQKEFKQIYEKINILYSEISNKNNKICNDLNDISIILDDIIMNQIDDKIQISEEIIQTEILKYKMEKEALLKEINILKKDSFITEKKIENIYTLIERLRNEKK